MGVRIPLAVFRFGRRRVVGQARIDEFGVVTVRVRDKIVLELMRNEPGQLTWGPPTHFKEKNCQACTMGLCGDEPKEANCACCKYDHVE